ncbi:hypothetical protein L6452_05799 [Arctium lappa]|uniref:Uncharacterized protein n=1 Tax=Arctium lappa TaxID=4217 RepID=A0ACB9EHP7_ARCLA|nr:hypothetical protein L6452_05799 [Arctium lappa]
MTMVQSFQSGDFSEVHHYNNTFNSEEIFLHCLFQFQCHFFNHYLNFLISKEHLDYDIVKSSHSKLKSCTDNSAKVGYTGKVIIGMDVVASNFNDNKVNSLVLF